MGKGFYIKSYAWSMERGSESNTTALGPWYHRDDYGALEKENQALKLEVRNLKACAEIAVEAGKSLEATKHCDMNKDFLKINN